jgi:hypothetical protein
VQSKRKAIGFGNDFEIIEMSLDKQKRIKIKL